MVQVQRRPCESMPGGRDKTGGPGVGEEKDKGRNSESETSLIVSMNGTG